MSIVHFNQCKSLSAARAFEKKRKRQKLNNDDEAQKISEDAWESFILAPTVERVCSQFKEPFDISTTTKAAFDN
jgi:hypothetical protein